MRHKRTQSYLIGGREPRVTRIQPEVAAIIDAALTDAYARSARLTLRAMGALMCTGEYRPLRPTYRALHSVVALHIAHANQGRPDDDRLARPSLSTVFARERARASGRPSFVRRMSLGQAVPDLRDAPTIAGDAVSSRGWTSCRFPVILEYASGDPSVVRSDADQIMLLLLWRTHPHEGRLGSRGKGFSATEDYVDES